MSLIEEALRQQQEQERQRQLQLAQQAQAQTPQTPQPAPLEPPPIPPQPEIVPSVKNGLSTGTKPFQVVLIVFMLFVMLGGAAGLAWWLFSTQARTGDPEPEAVTVSPLPEGATTDPEPAPAKPEPSKPKHPYSAAVATLEAARALTHRPATDTTDPLDEPAPTVEASAPSPVEPAKIVEEKPARPKLTLPWRTHRETTRTNLETTPAAWPEFSIKGRIASGHKITLILDNGQLLQQGERTPEGVLFVRAENDRVRLTFKNQVRDYQLKGGAFVLLPPEEEDEP